ncbi:MAG: mersacidin/lichenicidin family type 2 lantibiotic [Acidobacteria bacterium]|nr:mersacidin/lichenicidin family type 2 lantibiotic [Acidobacteriota bacterium]
MSRNNIIRAWKDEEYRSSLSEAERALLPENPAGLIELSDADLGNAVAGGRRPRTSSITCSEDCVTQRHNSYNCCYA